MSDRCLSDRCQDCKRNYPWGRYLSGDQNPDGLSQMMQSDLSAPDHGRPRVKMVYRLNEIYDPSILKIFLRKAMKANSLKEFEQIIDLMMK